MNPRWDIFCKVVDNYGDAGVCWRLARGLAAEHGAAPRLWVDGLATLARLAPEVDPARDEQAFAGIAVRRWERPFPDIAPGAVVIESFGCGVPDTFAARMAQTKPQPVWINVEHLSAESWVEDCHGLPSPHPRLCINRWFFFPGFGERTGGLIREQDVIARRDAFWRTPDDEKALWRELGVPLERQAEELRVLFFCYDTAGAAALLKTLARAARPIRLLVPEGVGEKALNTVFSAGPRTAGTAMQQGHLTVHIIPFLPQARWDRLLWACDANIVRGEDSFVRAQWAARPFLWAIYPQVDGAHRAKMSAFLARYAEGLEPAAAAAIVNLARAWENGRALDIAWDAFVRELPALAAHARDWASRLAAKPDLVNNIVEFASRV